MPVSSVLFRVTSVQGAFCAFGPAALATLLVCTLMLAVPGCSREKPTHKQAIERYGEELREAVSGSVPDPGRREQMLRTVDRLEALQLRFSRETAEFIESYRKLNADYDAPRAAFDQLFADYTARRGEARGEALDLHFELASLATVDEWDKLGKAETKLYEELNAARPGEGNTK